ncbi:MAG: AAA family ATPase [Myxococcota bacterium]
MDYLKFYELETEPFRNEPDPRFYFESATHARTRLRIARAVTQHLGLAVLLGGPGCGKTTLAYGIEASLQGDGSLVRRVSVPRSDCDGNWLLGRIASEFGVPDQSGDPLWALEQLEKRLVQESQQGRHPVLLLDEAQMLRQPARMEELRALLNLEHPDGRRAATLVLFGLPDLLQTLEQDPSLLQRVEIRQELQPLARSEAIAYLAHRLECAGGHGNLFTEEALDALAHLSKGVPRLLNSLADNALFEGALARTRPVDASLVAAACEAVGIETGACDLQVMSAAEAANLEPETPGVETPSPAAPARAELLDDVEPTTEIDLLGSEPEAPAVETGDFGKAELEPADASPAEVELPKTSHPRPAEIASPSLDETQTFDPEEAMLDAPEADASASVDPGGADGGEPEASLPDLELDLSEDEEAALGDPESADALAENAESQILGVSLPDAPGVTAPSPQARDEGDSELDFDLDLELGLEPEEPAAADGAGAPDEEGAIRAVVETSPEDDDPITAFEFEVDVDVDVDGEEDAGEGELGLELEPPDAPATTAPAAAEAPESRLAEAPMPDGPDDDDSLDMLDSLFEGIQI